MLSRKPHNDKSDKAQGVNCKVNDTVFHDVKPLVFRL